MEMDILNWNKIASLNSKLHYYFVIDLMNTMVQLFEHSDIDTLCSIYPQHFRKYKHMKYKINPHNKNFSTTYRDLILFTPKKKTKSHFSIFFAIKDISNTFKYKPNDGICVSNFGTINSSYRIIKTYKHEFRPNFQKILKDLISRIGSKERATTLLRKIKMLHKSCTTNSQRTSEIESLLFFQFYKRTR